MSIADEADDQDEVDLGSVRWFGDSWGAEACEIRLHVQTPVGNKCHRCGVALQWGDQGLRVPYIAARDRATWSDWHLDCWLWELGIAPQEVTT